MTDRAKFWVVAVSFGILCGLADRGIKAQTYPTEERLFTASHPFDTIYISEEPSPGRFTAKRVVWKMAGGKVFELRPDGRGNLLVQEMRK